jgi:predicted amidohydrolase
MGDKETMTLTLACHQLSLSSVKPENLSRITSTINGSPAYLDIFPEYAMGVPTGGLTRRLVEENAEPLDGNFVGTILDATRQRKSAAVFTAFLKENQGIYNAAILAEQGKIRSVYKKIHLFDAYGYRESELFVPGKQLAVQEVKDFRIGLAVCFDLRFPELFRSMAYKGVDLFVVPSGWYKGNHKLEQWRILVMARAHENTAYLAAVDQTDPLFVGHTMVASPLGYAIREIGEEQTSFTVELDRKDIIEVRKSVPVLSLSRPELYREFNTI